MDGQRVLVVKLGSIGDVIHALPAVCLLRRLMPEARIDWLVEAKSAPVLRGNPKISSLLVLDRAKLHRLIWRRPFRAVADAWRLLVRVSSSRYDIAVDLQGLVKSGIWVWASRAPLRFGLPPGECREPANALFTNVRCWHAVDAKHISEKLCGVVWGVGEELGLVRPKAEARWCDPPEFHISVSEEHVQDFRSFLKAQGVGEEDVVIGINPCAGWETKRWGSQNFARAMREVGERVLGRKVWFVVLFGPGERSFAEAVVRLAGRLGLSNAFVAPPSDIPMLGAILTRCDVVVSGDTGVLHLAAALGRPTVGIFGPTDPTRNGPFGNRSIVLHHEIACWPCYKRKCKYLGCITNISPYKVAEAIVALAAQDREEGRSRPHGTSRQPGVSAG